MTNAKGKTSNSSKPVSDAPEGFEPVSVSGKQTWWKPEKGKTLQGVLIGRFQRKGKSAKGFFYQAKLTVGCAAIRREDDGDDMEIIHCEPGDIVCFDEKSGLSDLKALCEDGGQYEIWIKAIDKIPLDGGQTFWKFDVRKKTLKRAPKVDDSDIPF